MSSNTPNLDLFKKDPITEGTDTFNVKTMMNDNWDKIDAAVGQIKDDIQDIDIDIPDASLTVAGKTMLSNATNGTSEAKAATEKAVGLVMAEATAGKQAGNERKAEVVALLIAKGIAATTAESWDSLIAKLTAIIVATGNALLSDVRAGVPFSNATANGLVGTMPVRGANINATGTGRWPDGALAVYFPDGWYGGGLNGGSEAKVTPAQIRASFPEIASGNVRAGVAMLGIVGKSTVVDTEGSSGDVASLLYAGRVAYANGQRVVGTLPDRSGNIAPQTYNVAIPAGYHNGQGVVLGYVPGKKFTEINMGKMTAYESRAVNVGFVPSIVEIWALTDDGRFALATAHISGGVIGNSKYLYGFRGALNGYVNIATLSMQGGSTSVHVFDSVLTQTFNIANSYALASYEAFFVRAWE